MIRNNFAVAGIMIKFHDSCKNPDIVQGPPGLLHSSAPVPSNRYKFAHPKPAGHDGNVGVDAGHPDLQNRTRADFPLVPLFFPPTPETIQTNPEYETHRHYK